MQAHRRRRKPQYTTHHHSTFKKKSQTIIMQRARESQSQSQSIFYQMSIKPSPSLSSYVQNPQNFPRTNKLRFHHHITTYVTHSSTNKTTPLYGPPVSSVTEFSKCKSPLPNIPKFISTILYDDDRKNIPQMLTCQPLTSIVASSVVCPHRHNFPCRSHRNQSTSCCIIIAATK